MKIYSKEILMLTYCLLLSVVLLIFSCNDSKPANSEATESKFSLAYKRCGGDFTSTFLEVIDFDEPLLEKNNRVSIESISETDNGEPLHLLSFKPEDGYQS
jgi:hypothetical protein